MASSPPPAAAAEPALEPSSPEAEALARLAANHIFLGQLEPFRACIIALRRCDPSLASAILRFAIASGGRIDGALGVSPRLALLAAVELGTAGDHPDPDGLVLKAEFLVSVDSVVERTSGEDSRSLAALHKLLDLGAKRLRREVEDLQVGDHESFVMLDEEWRSLWGVFVYEAMEFEAVGRGVAMRIEGENPEFKDTLIGLLKHVQLAHLDAVRRSMEVDDLDGAVSQLRFLCLGRGIDEAEYKYVLEDLVRKGCLQSLSDGNKWLSSYHNMAKVYNAVLQSECTRIARLVQLIQDEVLSKEIEEDCSSSVDWCPLPLKKFLETLPSEKTCSQDEKIPVEVAMRTCRRELYHYARVSGAHVFDIIVETALTAICKQALQEANEIVSLFPLLQPLVAALGWDLLSGKTFLRRKLMWLFWISKSQELRLQESPRYRKQGNDISCVEYLCDLLCYHLDLALFVATVNSGQLWNSRKSLFFSRSEQALTDIDNGLLDPFVENLILERLAVQSPMRVLFDVVPGIKFQDAIELIGMQPLSSTTAAWKRLHDIELMHMRYALTSAVLAFGEMEKCSGVENDSHFSSALAYVRQMQDHMEAIQSTSRKVFMVNVTLCLFHVEDNFILATEDISSEKSVTYGSLNLGSGCEGHSKMVVSFISALFDVLRHNLMFTTLLSWNPVLEHLSNSSLTVGGRQALEWRVSAAKHFIDDLEWRLSVLQRLPPLSARVWSWKEALVLLRAAPSKLLNLCMQRASYDIGEEAVRRFSLSPEDKAAFELAEWVAGIFRKALVEDAVARAADSSENSSHELDISSFCAQIGHLTTVLLCIDAAATSARSRDMCRYLLNQGSSLLSEISAGSISEAGLSYWDQIRDLTMMSVVKRVLQRLNDLFKLEMYSNLREFFTEGLNFIPSTESSRLGQKQRPLTLLHQMIDDTFQGKRQFLSGKLHNVAKAIADEDPYSLHLKRGKGFQGSEQGVVFGLGLRISKPNTSLISREEMGSSLSDSGLEHRNQGDRFIGPLTSKPSTYLSNFIVYVATIGDIVDGIDTTHDFNYFSLVYEWPKDLLTRLVFERGSTDAAARVADTMGVDFVHEIVSASVPPVLPPRNGHGWACIPLMPTLSQAPSTTSSHDPLPAFTLQKPLYPLQLNLAKHLAQLSPVRAVLACVFGSTMLSGENESSPGNFEVAGTQSLETGRSFYEFALEQSERYPTLNRWIQMQSNLHRVSETSVSAHIENDFVMHKPKGRMSIKRTRVPESDVESEIDDTFLKSNMSSTSPDFSKPDDVKPGPTVYVSFDWENEGPYEKTIERLINEGKLLDALAVSDRCLRDGASDQLLQLLIERREDDISAKQAHASRSRIVICNTWQYCLRLRDKSLASKLALEYVNSWDLDPALEVLSMCISHLLTNDEIRGKVLRKRQALELYGHILMADDSYSCWQEVEADCLDDAEGLALRLAGKGAVPAALEVAESASLSLDLRRELQGRQLVKLLTTDPLSGGGPAAASRFLSSLCDSNEALAVAIGAMKLLPDLRSKQILVHFFLKRNVGSLSGTEVARLNTWALGLRVLSLLPLPSQQRCSSLHEHPQLIVEVLLMMKQLQSASLVLKEIQSLRNDDLIISYARKALTVNMSSTQREPRTIVSELKNKQKKIGSLSRPNFVQSIGQLQREARRAFSWGSRDNGTTPIQKEVHRKRKTSGLGAPEREPPESISGGHEERSSAYPSDGQERLSLVSVSEEWMLTGDPEKDDATRALHTYESSPDITLFKALLTLCTEELVAAKGALEICISQMKFILSSQHLPLDSSMETLSRAYYATEAFVQALSFARSQLKKLAGSNDLSSSSERSKEYKDADDASVDTYSSSTSSQYLDDLPDLLPQAELWLGRAELLQSLLGSGIVASLDDVADKESSNCLRDRLIQEERYSMAVYTCKKCKVDSFPVWNAWGHALIRMEHYAQARVKFKQALQLYKGDITTIALEIINTVEAGPPVDVAAVRSLYEHLARSAATIFDDSLSADAYLNVLYMPSTFPRSERSRRSKEATNDRLAYSTKDSTDGPRSNLDNVRYAECVHYLQEYARLRLLGFMFKHGHYADACCLFFPALQSSPDTESVSSSIQLVDPMSTDYGSIDNLCDLCIGYGVMSVLEDTLSETMQSSAYNDIAGSQYISTALARICSYCETHRHFNYLYRFLVLRGDVVACGLCCIQLYINSLSQDTALKHLDRAKVHFEEALTIRDRAGSVYVRGKSASEKLTTERILKFSARVSYQIDVVKALNSPEGPQWSTSLFGNPSEPETTRRRCFVVESLAEKHFDLAFRLLYEFDLPAVDIYAGVASSLADRKHGGQLTEFLNNIKGTIDDDEWDQVLVVAINVYANKHKERPDRLIDMLVSSHRKVLACVVCGRLKSAFQIASRSGSVADVQYVAHQALHANALPVLDLCKQWLAQYM